MFCLCSLFYRDDVLCWLLLARPFLYAFHAHLRFPVDLVWFRLSCDHGWIRSGSVNVRKQQQQQQQTHKKIADHVRFENRGPFIDCFDKRRISIVSVTGGHGPRISPHAAQLIEAFLHGVGLFVCDGRRGVSRTNHQGPSIVTAIERNANMSHKIYAQSFHCPATPGLPNAAEPHA